MSNTYALADLISAQIRNGGIMILQLGTETVNVTGNLVIINFNEHIFCIIICKKVFILIPINRPILVISIISADRYISLAVVYSSFISTIDTYHCWT